MRLDITIADVMEFLRSERHRGESLWQTAKRLMIVEAMKATYGYGQIARAAVILGVNKQTLGHYLRGDARSWPLVECPIWRDAQGYKPRKDAALSKALAQGGLLGRSEGSASEEPLASSVFSKESR